MNELIKITEKEGKRVVSARELHKFLEASERFSAWADRQLQYGFVENVDYVGCKEFNTLANQELTDYALTIETAKHWAMMQRSDKGMQIRNYFIECEKKLQSSIPAIPQTFAEALQLAADQAKLLEVKDQQILELEPKATYYDNILSSQDAVAISIIAKDYGLSAIALNKVLHDLKIQYKQSDTWLLYQNYACMGYTKTKTTSFERTDGTKGVSVLTKWTQKGRLFLYDILKSNNILPLIEQ